MDESAQLISTQGTEKVEAVETVGSSEPQVPVVVNRAVGPPQNRSRADDCPYAVTVTVQVSAFLEPRGLATGLQRSPDDGDTDTGGSSKGGLGVDSAQRSPDDGDTDTPPSTKGGLGVDPASETVSAGSVQGATATAARTKAGLGG